MINKIFVSVFIFCIMIVHSFGQSRKKQIEKLNRLLDSCKTVILNQNTEIYSKQVKLSDLEKKMFYEQENLHKKSKEIASLKKEITLLKSDKTVDACFKFKVIHKAEDQDGRVGTNSETKVFLMIENQHIDTYLGFGDPYMDELKVNEIELTSEEIGKIYIIHSISPNVVLVEKSYLVMNMYQRGCATLKYYKKDAFGIWKYAGSFGEDEFFYIRDAD